MTCAKIPFSTKAEARKSAAGLSRRQFGGWRRGRFVIAYPCRECSVNGLTVWHMARSKPGAPRRAI